MKILLWILQSGLALLYVSGGAYKMSSFSQIEEPMSPLPGGLVSVIGLFEILGGSLLVLPALLKRSRKVIPAAAAALSLESMGLSVLYAGHSLELTAANPLVWSFPMALLSALVAFRWKKKLKG